MAERKAVTWAMLMKIAGFVELINEWMEIYETPVFSCFDIIHDIIPHIELQRSAQ